MDFTVNPSHRKCILKVTEWAEMRVSIYSFLPGKILVNELSPGWRGGVEITRNSILFHSVPVGR